MSHYCNTLFCQLKEFIKWILLWLLSIFIFLCIIYPFQNASTLPGGKQKPRVVITTLITNDDNATMLHFDPHHGAPERPRKASIWIYTFLTLLTIYRILTFTFHVCISVNLFWVRFKNFKMPQQLNSLLDIYTLNIAFDCFTCFSRIPYLKSKTGPSYCYCPSICLFVCHQAYSLSVLNIFVATRVVLL